jgi:DNA excision repair protein ERCC-3
MFSSPGSPLIIQGDQSILLDLHDPLADEARKAIAPFAELEKSPEHIHSYRLNPLSLWNAAAAGYDTGQIMEILDGYSRYPIPESVERSVRETMGRFGLISLKPSAQISEATAGLYFLEVADRRLYEILDNQRSFKKLVIPAENISATHRGFLIHPLQRGTVKQELIRMGYPVRDLIPLRPGETLELTARETALSGKPFEIRDYQRQAAESFLGDLQGGTGYGTIVLPCGGGKTIVGIDVMVRLGTHTLILAPNVSAVHQWKRELLDKTSLTEDQIGEYSGQVKEIRPVTIATYQILIYRPEVDGPFPHFALVTRESWGLIIYDEVHLLPAPIFRVTAEIQAVRRLGLTATLVREDGRETEVFSLVGPKRFDVPWKDLENRGWISEAICKEIRVELPDELQVPYATADKRKKYRIASENPRKFAIVDYLIHHHPQDQILIIGQYLDQLDAVRRRLGSPIITGKTPTGERDELYQRFRDGDIRILIVSKVANFAIDLPDASVAIQISGSFGSRQEEAQRLGRILRPKDHSAYFYSLISRYTVEEEFGMNRQKFLAEQGYAYLLDVWDD